MVEVKGYKVFNPDWTCRGFQYEVGKVYEEDVTPDVCEAGFHFCKEAINCFNYYSFDPNNKVAEVLALGDVSGGDDKCATNRIQIVREIPWAELLGLVNQGIGNTGRSNTGNCNTGNCNTGDCNTGDCNTGNCNTGDWNTGDCNTGNCNLSNGNAGCFNTEEHQVRIFDEESNITLRQWRDSEAYRVLSRVSPTTWVYTEDMMEDEKNKHPGHETAGGYLKTIDMKEAFGIWWDTLDENEKNVIMAIPNFNAEKFYKITSIQV